MIEGGGGADAIDGGRGWDTASYAGSAAGVTVDLALNTPQSGGDAEGDTFTSIEGLEGSTHDDTLSGDRRGQHRSRAARGDDRLEGRAGGDTLNGGAGADFLDGGAGYRHGVLCGAPAPG